MASDIFWPAIWFFLLSFAAGATIYFAVDRGDRSFQRRLEDMVLKLREGGGRDLQDQEVSHGVAATFVDWAERRMPESNQEKPATKKLVETLQHAGFYSPSALKVFMALRVVLSVGFAVAGYTLALLLGRSAFFVAFVGGGLGYVTPIIGLRWMANSRQTTIRREIADVIDLLVVCVECGLGLTAAIRAVGRESERQGRIMGTQLGILSAELNSGGTLGDGMRAIAQRTGVDDIRVFSSILVQSERLGTEMAQALRATADQLRIKRSMRAEEVAHKLPVKMIFPMVFFLLPAVMLLLAGPPMVQIMRGFSFH